MAASATTLPQRRNRPLAIILQAGLLAGFLDGLDAALFIGVARRIPPSRVFQFIASGLLGVSSFRGGWATAALGVALHFLIAISAAAVFYAISLKLPMLARKPVLWGPVYGVGVFLVMHYLVVPLSAAPKQPPAAAADLLNLIISHIFFVGLPIAVMTARALRNR